MRTFTCFYVMSLGFICISANIYIEDAQARVLNMLKDIIGECLAIANLNYFNLNTTKQQKMLIEFLPS